MIAALSGLNRRRIAGFIALAAFICGGVKTASGQQGDLPANLIRQFYAKQYFWQQFEVAEKLVKLHDTTVLSKLEPLLNDENRHVRGNAAFVFAALGDDRGFKVILDILRDRPPDRPRGDGTMGNWSVWSQIKSDRYYAAHLFGELKDARAVPILIPMLTDEDVNWTVPWSLGEIGDKAAIPPLIRELSDPSPDMRVLSIDALEQLGAKEALPQLRLLLEDKQTIHFDGLGTVAEAAKSAIAKLEAIP